MVPCLDRGNLWLQQSVVPKIHTSHNKASQSEVHVAGSTVLQVPKDKYNFRLNDNFSLDKYKNS